MHKHWCDVVGHEYECADQSCGCVCGEQMEGHDHKDCPIELRACPEHEGQYEAELSPDALEIDFSVLSPELPKSSPQCQCGCAEIDAAQIIGWCMWCSHVYSEWNLLIQNRHFANDCPGTPDKMKDSARERLAKHNA